MPIPDQPILGSAERLRALTAGIRQYGVRKLWDERPEIASAWFDIAGQPPIGLASIELFDGVNEMDPLSVGTQEELEAVGAIIVGEPVQWRAWPFSSWTVSVVEAQCEHHATAGTDADGNRLWSSLGYNWVATALLFSSADRQILALTTSSPLHFQLIEQVDEIRGHLESARILLLEDYLSALPPR